MDEQRGNTGWTEMGTLTACDKTVKTCSATGMHPAFVFGEGGLLLRLYII
jgi:hypothetical protein